MLELNKERLMEIHKASLERLAAHPLFDSCKDNLIVQAGVFVEFVDKSLYLNQIKNIDASDTIPSSDILSFVGWMANKRNGKCDCLSLHTPNLNDREILVDFLKQCASYVAFHDFLRMSLANDYTAYELGENKISFEPNPKTDSQILFADFSYGSRRSGVSGDPAGLTKNLLESVPRNAFIDSGIARYTFDWNEFSKVVDALDELLGKVNLFGKITIPRKYDLSDFRKAWTVLSARSFLHRIKLSGLMPTYQNEVFAASALIAERTEWTSFLSNACGISEEAATELVDDLTYRAEKYKYHDSGPLPPLYPIKEGLILLSRVLLASLAEEDLFRIYGLVAPKVQEVLVQTNEMRQRERIASMFHKTDVELLGPFDGIVTAKRNTNLDCLILSKRLRIGLCCELKTLAAPRWRKDIGHAAEELRDAVEQVTACLDWVKNLPDALITHAKMVRQDLSKFQFEGMVISNGPLGGGLVESPSDIPIINEAMLNEAITAVKEGDLAELWKHLSTRQNMAELKVDFELYDLTGNCQPYSFSARNVLARSAGSI